MLVLNLTRVLVQCNAQNILRHAVSYEKSNARVNARVSAMPKNILRHDSSLPTHTPLNAFILTPVHKTRICPKGAISVVVNRDKSFYGYFYNIIWDSESHQVYLRFTSRLTNFVLVSLQHFIFLIEYNENLTRALTRALVQCPKIFFVMTRHYQHTHLWMPSFWLLFIRLVSVQRERSVWSSIATNHFTAIFIT